MERRPRTLANGASFILNISRCRVQPYPAEDVNVGDQTLTREYSVA